MTRWPLLLRHAQDKCYMYWISALLLLGMNHQYVVGLSQHFTFVVVMNIGNFSSGWFKFCHNSLLNVAKLSFTSLPVCAAPPVPVLWQQCSPAVWSRRMSQSPEVKDDSMECPLCMEPLEIDDVNFFPCTCGYQICRFCWHRIRTDENGLCPACRKVDSVLS